MQPTVGSLFAGIGGIDLGFERAGFKTAWQVEIDPFCREVLKKNFPDADRRCIDVRSGNSSTLSRVDVVAGGFPCQDISIAGRGEGITGARSGLWKEYYRIIREIQPKYVVIENVTALLKRGLGVVLEDLSHVGYDAEWRNIPGSAFGSPQSRQRIWIVAYPSGKRNKRLLEGQNISAVRQGWPGGSAYLQDIARTPFVGTNCFPQPLLRGMDDRPANWVDRVRSCGNSVIPQIPEYLAGLILRDMKRPENGQGVDSAP